MFYINFSLKGKKFMIFIGNIRIVNFFLLSRFTSHCVYDDRPGYGSASWDTLLSYWSRWGMAVKIFNNSMDDMHMYIHVIRNDLSMERYIHVICV